MHAGVDDRRRRASLILADVVARTMQAPAEIPIGVVTAFVGAPFFLFVLLSARGRTGRAVITYRRRPHAL